MQFAQNVTIELKKRNGKQFKKEKLKYFQELTFGFGEGDFNRFLTFVRNDK
jgi:uncharacterized protein YggL (DUF469 family)